MASALTKAFEVVKTLRRTSTPMSLTAIASETGISPSTAHSVLGEMLAQGVVSQDKDKRYRTGPALYYWGSSFARNTPIYRTLWREMVDISNELSVVGVIAVPWDDHHLILQANHSEGAGIGVAFGGRVPLDAGSWGKAFYAWSDAPLPKQLTRYTPRTIEDPNVYAEHVEEARQLGYATDHQEFDDGFEGVASGVTSERGYEGLGSFLAPADRMQELTPEAVGLRLAEATSRASFSLGDPGRLRLVGSE
ncbi:MAG TPA: helix-turn-helix domain-containing protein [Solirubrobacterales bacterium]|nr:helix-turn-helix domain-containing protein [Solirubrobacterales bacterium]